jgi:hypothetical protein
MTSDRYFKGILTIIALELGWLAFAQSATPVTAQPAPTRVVITDVEIGANRGYLPVAVLGQVGSPDRRFQPLDTTIRNDRVAVSVGQPVDVRPVGVIKIEADRPLLVENVGYKPAQRPGE